MASFETYWNRLRDAFRDSPVVIEAKSRFSALDPKHQEWILAGGLGFSALVLILLPVTLFFSNWGTERDIARIEEQTEYLNYGASEIRELRALISQQSTTADPSINRDTPVREVAAKVVAQALIQEEAAAIEDSGTNGISLKLNKINLRQLVRLLYAIENSAAGLDVKAVEIDTKGDKTGYLWSNISFQKRPVVASPTISPPSPKKFIR